MAYLDFALRGIGIFGSGAFFGMVLSIPTVTLPMLLRHEDITTRQRVELWNDLNTLVDQRWVPFGLLSSVTFGVAAHYTQCDKTLPTAAAVSMFSLVPVTVAFVVPYVNKLRSYLKGGVLSDDEVLKTLRTWGKVHLLRTVCAGLATAIGLCDVVSVVSK